MYFSLVIPAYNEAKKIALDIEAARHFLGAQPFDSEVLIVNDGSRDATKAMAEAAAERMQTEKVTIRVLDYGQNRGKGFAIRFGVQAARGERIAFADSGLCVPFHFFLRGLEALESGADFAIASRRLKETKIQVQQPLHRQLGSKIFWFVVKGFMGVQVSDTQCGFKLYKQKAAKMIFGKVVTDGFMFDIEALLIAKKLKLKAAEFAVEWSNDSDTRYHPIWGTLRNFKELSRIRFRSLCAFNA